VSSDYKSIFVAAVDNLWASDLNARIGELNAEIKRWQHELQMVKSDEVVAEKIEDDLDTIAQLFAEKIRRVDELIERYIAATGERPDARQLDRLATWLLKGAEHGDIDAEVLTAPQRYRRKKRELPDMLIDGKIMNDDGNTYREPKPSMDEKGSHFEYVRMPSDNEDKRKFNGSMRRYNVNFNGKK